MKYKRMLALALVLLILTTIAVGCMACSASAAKDMAKKLLTAESFTVEKDGVEILRYNGNKLYWKYVYESVYIEYYLEPDGEGKYWVYERLYTDDQWTKEAWTIDEYFGFLNALRCDLGSGLGLGQELFQTIECIYLDFDAIMQKSGSAYKLRSEFMGLQELQLSKESGKLVIYCSTKDRYGDVTSVRLLVKKINKTKVKIPESAKNAQVGSVLN